MLFIYELGTSRHQLEPYELLSLKRKYGVSMQAWGFRARDLGILSESGLSFVLDHGQP